MVKERSDDGAERSGLRAELTARRRLLGTFVMIPRVEIVEMLASAGFDVAVFDLEHAPIDVADLPPLAAAARGSGMFAVARLSSSAPAEVAKALDAGVDGLLVPHVSSGDEARRVVASGRFPPEGERSLNPYVRGTDYGRGDGNGPDEGNACARRLGVHATTRLRKADLIRAIAPSLRVSS